MDLGNSSDVIALKNQERNLKTQEIMTIWATKVPVSNGTLEKMKPSQGRV